MKKQKKTGLLDNPYIDIILIIIIPVIVYFQVLSFGFTNSDDKLIISDNQSFFADISNVGKAFTKDAFITNSYELYRPLQTVTFLIDTMIGNGEVKYYHITNLLLHILVCLSIFYLLLKFGFPRIQSLLLVLIFSSAPLFSHVVAWIPARGELLLMLFGINSLNFFIHYLESKKNIYFLLNILFFLLALFSKESAIIFVLFYIFYYIFIYNNNRKFLTLNNMIILISWIIPLILYYIIRNSEITFHSDSSIAGIGDFLKNLPTISETLAKFFIPVNLSVVPAFKITTTITGILILLAIIANLIIKKEFKNSIVIYGFVWFLLFTIPGMLYNRIELSSLHFDYSEHRAYIPMFGILLILSYLLSKLTNTKNETKYTTTLILLVLIYSIVNIMHTSCYANPLSYYSQAAESNPESSFCFNNLALAQSEKGNNDQAVENYSRAISLKPDFADAYNNRGYIKLSQGHFQESIKDFTLAIKYKPSLDFAYNNRGLAYLLINKTDSAFRDINKAISMNKKNPYAYLNRAKAYISVNDINSACNDLNLASIAGMDEAISLKQKYCKKK